MLYKYCAVAMGKGVGDFREMVDFARCGEYKSGLMAGDSLLVVTFISTFSKYEVYNIFEGVADINFVLTEVDENSVKFQTHNMNEKLMGIFLEVPEINREEDIDSYGIVSTEEQEEAIEEEYKTIISEMSPKEKQEKINEILDKMPNISDGDRLLLSMLSE